MIYFIGPVKPLALGFSMDESSNPADDSGEASSSGLSKCMSFKRVVFCLFDPHLCALVTAKKVAPLIASKKVLYLVDVRLTHARDCLNFIYLWLHFQTVNNINKWNQVQEELTNDTGISSVAAPPALVTYISWLFLSARTWISLWFLRSEYHMCRQRRRTPVDSP